ncbi:hypothetical protein JHN55_25230 [Streptomyces sp. MBT56]|uniref:hypothetical protein n=1 Tax=unclassified Streptomyces TaxID=2593676 RepID=UPI00190C08E4|nr:MULTISPECIES: hypothetical protein [unclassified Streptomyces]MBK3559768.1 hypothetical protein [Streptomyces sp. MBT56]MBK3601290.1 hypothetical protein [Streptomyces sp. MBT54]MBK3615263.1 hypothetical protein [Streptomyces sp. MBT98]
MSDLQNIARARVAELAAARRATTTPVKSSKIHRDNSDRNFSNIETSDANKRWDEFNLPEWLAPLVQNPMWARRFASLLNDGHQARLRKLVEVVELHAHNKVHFLNKSCSRANWEETVQRMNKLLTAEHLANEVEQRLGEVTADQKRAIHAVVIRLRDRVLQYAAQVQETMRRGRLKTNAFKFFAWLTSSAGIERQRLALAAWPSKATA